MIQQFAKLQQKIENAARYERHCNDQMCVCWKWRKCAHNYHSNYIAAQSTCAWIRLHKPWRTELLSIMKMCMSRNATIITPLQPFTRATFTRNCEVKHTFPSKCIMLIVPVFDDMAQMRPQMRHVQN